MDTWQFNKAVYHLKKRVLCLLFEKRLNILKSCKTNAFFLIYIMHSKESHDILKNMMRYIWMEDTGIFKVL